MQVLKTARRMPPWIVTINRPDNGALIFREPDAGDHTLFRFVWRGRIGEVCRTEVVGDGGGESWGGGLESIMVYAV